MKQTNQDYRETHEYDMQSVSQSVSYRHGAVRGMAAKSTLAGA